ncbi:MAG: hypothetical protein M1840_007881 [Geoglossum simile]|nr:MAG: hypothetical protein M1840_007881 [Geoglossum simile]
MLSTVLRVVASRKPLPPPLAIVLRAFQLTVLQAIGPWLETQERPKVAISTDRTHALLRMGIHFLPLCASTVLIGVNSAEYYIGTDVKWLPLLQFLAKAIEIWTQASIATVLVAYVRHEVLSEEGLPFGAIFSGLQTINLSYLWSLEFWGSATSKCLSSRRRAVFLLFVPLNLVLAASVGPSIAIALIPRRHPTFPASVTSMWLNGSEDVLYPKHLKAAHIPPNCSTATIADTTIGNCPSSQWETLIPELGDEEPIQMRTWRSNRLLMRDLGTSYVRGVYRPESKATIPQFAVTEAVLTVGNAWLFTRHRMPREFSSATITAHVKQPLALAVCEAVPDEGNAQPVTFPVGYNISSFLGSRRYSGSGVYGSANHSTLTAADIWGLARNNTLHYTKWVDLPASNFPGVSIGAVITPPGSMLRDVPPVACSIFAGWATSPINVTTSTWETSQGVTPPIIGLWATPAGGIPPWDQVHISAKWADSLTPPIVGQDRSLIDFLLMTEGTHPSRGTRTMLYSNTLAALVVNGMARTGFNLVPLGNWDDSRFTPSPRRMVAWAKGENRNPLAITPAQATGNYQFTITITIDGLSYSTTGAPIKIALAVLGLYVSYILAFFIYTALSGISSSSWDSISELFTLAILSPQSRKARNTSAGIETVRLFREPVAIRSRSGEDGLEIVFLGDQNSVASKTIQKDHAY